ncbi:MAG: DUF4349 domain-containing protein [Deltaproteobacteria bacterium]|nr:DUF4349 domain-containing protein [Deltaproteobacteria bacterium]
MFVILATCSQSIACAGGRRLSASRAQSHGGYAIASVSSASGGESMPSTASDDGDRYRQSESPGDVDVASVGGAVAPTSVAPRPSAARPTQPVRNARANAAPVRTTAVTNDRPNEGTAPTVSQTQAQPMLIYTAQLVATVDHVPSAIDAIIARVIERGGFLATRTDDTVTVRVPVASFRESLGRIEETTTVTRRQVQAEDVTESFHDLEVSLVNLRTVQARLQQFMARATNVAEALAVERELERVSAAIDTIEGRMRFLSNRAAYSTISVTLQARTPLVTVAERPAPPTVLSLPETTMNIELLEQLGLPRLLTAR